LKGLPRLSFGALKPATRQQVGTSEAYQRTLKTLGIECSMSRTGCCYDNAVMERFFWSLKHEWTNHERIVQPLFCKSDVGFGSGYGVALGR
jgi:transposase InsO family protein